MQVMTGVVMCSGMLTDIAGWFGLVWVGLG